MYLFLRRDIDIKLEIKIEWQKELQKPYKATLNYIILYTII